jgi:hypothetical protein
VNRNVMFSYNNNTIMFTIDKYIKYIPLWRLGKGKEKTLKGNRTRHEHHEQHKRMFTVDTGASGVRVTRLREKVRQEITTNKFTGTRNSIKAMTCVVWEHDREWHR